MENLGESFLDVIAGDVAAQDDLSTVVIHDGRPDPSFPRHSVVLGVTAHDPTEIRTLLVCLEEQQVAALIVRGPLVMTREITRRVESSSVVLLSVTPDASWLQLADALRMVLAENDIGDEVPSTLGGMPSGDLFSLANAIAALIDAPVTIEDRGFDVLAFSGRQNEADAARLETILDRRVPDRYIREDEERGLLRALYASQQPLYFEASTMTDNEIPRAAIAVRAGDEILGSIWAAVRGPLSDERTLALTEAAKLVAMHLMRHRAGADVDRRLRSDLVATALEGGSRAPQALGRLGILGKPVVVVALDVLDAVPGQGDPSRRAGGLLRASDALAMHLGAVVPRSAVALLGNVAYGLVPMSGDTDRGEDRARRLALDFLARAGAKAQAVVGIGTVADDASQLGQSQMRADRVLRVLRSRGVAGSVATTSDTHVDALLLELNDLSMARNDQVTHHLALLQEHDARRNGSLVETLECWINAFGDIHGAARAAGVHHNTFRYRLKRVAEVSTIDLDSPDDRFAMMLQLRLLRASEAAH
jgi:DNA-binding PucR family transcriptional regulator